MKLQKASVRLTRGTTSSGYRLTLYMGLNSDSGPSNPILLENENDLYKYFNTFSDDESFNTAAFCLRLGYKVYAQRVNEVTGKSSCRKFIYNGKNMFYSPLLDEYPEDNFHFIEPVVTESSSEIIDDSLYSAVISFPKPGIEVLDNTLVSDKLLVVVPRTVYDGVSGNTTIMYERLIGSGVTSQELSNYSSTPGHDKVLGTLYYKDFKDTIISFLMNNCALEVMIVTDDSIYVQSQAPIQSFMIVNDNVVGDTTEILSFNPSDVGLQDNYCRRYDDYKVCTITSKYENSLDDIEVHVTESLGEYNVDVYRYNSEGVVIYSESFSYSTSPEELNYIINLSSDSDLVDIDIHDTSKSASGVYLLRGKEKIEYETMYSNSVYEGELSDLAVDVVIDNSTSDQYNYIKKLRKTFNLSILMTGYDFVDPGNPDIFVKTCIVCPEVTWRATGNTLKGFTYLLYLLPTYSAGSDDIVLRRSNLPSSYTENCLIIEKSDYSIELMGANVSLVSNNSKFPIKSAISVIAVLNYMSHLSCRSEKEFRRYLFDIVSTVNQYLGTGTVVSAENVNILNYTLSATLSFYVDKQIILSYRVSATLVV